MRVYLSAALIILTGLGAAYAAFFERIDDRGFIIVIGDRIYEPAGYVNQTVNRMLRDCSEVEIIGSNSRQWEAVKAHLRTSLEEIGTGEPAWSSS